MKNCYDVFIPYAEVIKDTENLKYFYTKDTLGINFKGFYFAQLNYEYLINHLTTSNFRGENDHDFLYGVADNASQVYECINYCRQDELWAKYFEEAEKDEEFKGFIVVMTPIVKARQPEYCGWRWHKWGIYLGKFHKCHEYLYDEEGIEMVLCWKLQPLYKKKWN